MVKKNLTKRGKALRSSTMRQKGTGNVSTSGQASQPNGRQSRSMKKASVQNNSAPSIRTVSRSSSHSSLSSSSSSSRSSSSSSSSCSSSESDYSPPAKIAPKRGRPPKKAKRGTRQSLSTSASPIARSGRPKMKNVPESSGARHGRRMRQSPSVSTSSNSRNTRPKTKNIPEKSGAHQTERFSRTNCPAHIKMILKTSYGNNKYPSKEEIENLEELTKISRKDIRHWFKKERQIKKQLEKLKTMSKEERVKFCEKRRIYRWKKRCCPESELPESELVPENLKESQRDRYPEDFTNRLGQLFEITDYPTIDQKKELAEEFKNIGITLKKVTKWFTEQRNKRDDPNYFTKIREKNAERELSKKAGNYVPKKYVPDGLPLHEATPILEEFFAKHPENSEENCIKLNGKIGWSIKRIKTWYYNRRREEKNNGKVFPKKSNGRKRNQEFYFTEEIFEALNELFEKKQFLEKTSNDLDGIVPLATAQTWLYRKRGEILDAWMNGKLKELPWQMKKMEEYYSKSCFIEGDDLNKLSKQINLSGPRVMGYFESRRTFDRKAGKDIPTEEERKEKQREVNEDNNADSEQERQEDEEDEEAGDEDYDDANQKVEMEDDSMFDSDEEDVLEDDEEDAFIDEEDEEEEEETGLIQRSSLHGHNEMNLDFDFQHDESRIRREQPDRIEFDAPEKEEGSFSEIHQSPNQTVSRKIRNQECPEEMRKEDELLVEQLALDLENGVSAPNYDAIPRNNGTGKPALNWRFDYTLLPNNKNINYKEWTNNEFLEFGSHFLSERALQVLQTKEINGSHAKRFVSENPKLFQDLNMEDFENQRQPSFTWEEYKKVKHYLNILFALVDIDE